MPFTLLWFLFIFSRMDYSISEELNQELFTSYITSKSTQHKIWVKLFQTSVNSTLKFQNNSQQDFIILILQKDRYDTNISFELVQKTLKNYKGL